jgi:alpha-tubulin suppressor-like RCC1 family protein
MKDVVSSAVSVKCWGANAFGQLGLGDTASRGDQPFEMGDALPPVDLGSVGAVMQIGATYRHTCALVPGGKVKCWGWNEGGQLGLGDTNFRGDAPDEMGNALPVVDLGSGKSAVQVATGAASSCAVLSDGTVKCWGANDRGQLGLGDKLTRGDEPGEMGDALPTLDFGAGRKVEKLVMGNAFACVLLDNATVKCWGRNDLGELGLEDTLDRGDDPGEMGDNLPAVKLR